MQRSGPDGALESADSESDDDGFPNETRAHQTINERIGRPVARSRKGRKNTAATVTHSKQPTVGLEIYVRFEAQVVELDAELRKLGNKARALGRSAGILAASTRLRERLGRVLYLFRKNAEELYPEGIREHIIANRTPVKHVRRWKAKNFLDPTIKIQAPLQDNSDSTHDSLAQEFWQFSRDVITLFECFGQYPEFLEELPDFSIAEDLQMWANSLLENFENESTNMAFRQFLFDSMIEIGASLETLARHFIQVFTKIGIPTVKASQDHGASNLQNQTIVAALFAGVGTGMIQVFSTGGSGGLHDWIVLLWYMTLIFSVASAVNGLLNLSWMQAIYRSPDSHVPWWVIIWIKRFPLVFLVLAVGCFFVALILFALTPQQNRETLIVTIALSSASCFGLIIVSGWFTCELIVYSIYGGRKWLADIIWKDNILSFVQDQWGSLWEVRKKIPTVTVDLERANIPLQLRRRENVLDTGSHVDLLAFTKLKDQGNRPGITRSRLLWQKVRETYLSAKEQDQGSSRPLPETQASRFSNIIGATVNNNRHGTISKLQRMTITGLHTVEDSKQAMVRCLQFSPDGSLLVSSRWNSCSTVFELATVMDPLHGHSFEHPAKTGYIHQVDWSPDGSKLLMRSNRKLIVWKVTCGGGGQEFDASNDSAGSRNRDCQNSNINVTMMSRTELGNEGNTIRSARWHDNNEGFYYTEGKRLLTMSQNMSNQIAIMPDSSSQHLELRSLCTITSGSELVIVGAGRQVQEGQEQSKRYFIFAWDSRRKFKAANRVPVFYEICDVAIATDNKSILETFTTLPSVFGGEDDHLVLRVAKDGHIHIWDRDSATPVHCIKPQSVLDGPITSFAWNRGSKEYMFAIGMHDGTVQIWSNKEKQVEYCSDAQDTPTVYTHPGPLPVDRSKSTGRSTQ